MLPEKMWAPPWLAFPKLECGSMGWRMGAGEAFLEQWMPWQNSLTPEDRQAYEELFPQPMPWKQLSAQMGDLLHCGNLSLPLWHPQGLAKYDVQWAVHAKQEGTLPTALPFWHPTPSKDGRITMGCFSQWWPCEFWFRNGLFSSMEQCMMAGKAAIFGDHQTLREIMAQTDPRKIKALGRKVTPFAPEKWDEAKYTLVLNGNYSKFTQNEALRQFLLSTGDQLLVEASPYDTIWGVGLAPDDPDVQNPEHWRGSNLLGFALMEVRDEIRRVYANAHLCQEWR